MYMYIHTDPTKVQNYKTVFKGCLEAPNAARLPPDIIYQETN